MEAVMDNNLSGVIYVTTCIPTGKCYVGIHTRGQKAYLGSGIVLKLAIRKYGRENFVREDVVTFATIRKGLALERCWIRVLGTKVPNGYNLNDGGEGNFNPCQAVRDKISAAGIGNTKGKGHKWSDEQRARMIGNTYGKGHKCSDEQRAKMIGNTYAKGKHWKLSDEQRAKLIGNTNGKGKNLGNTNGKANKGKKYMTKARRAAEEARKR